MQESLGKDNGNKISKSSRNTSQFSPAKIFFSKTQFCSGLELQKQSVLKKYKVAVLFVL